MITLTRRLPTTPPVSIQTELQVLQNTSGIPCSTLGPRSPDRLLLASQRAARLYSIWNVYVNESKPSGLAWRFPFNGGVTEFSEVPPSREIQVWLFGVHDQAKLCDVEPLCSCYPFDANSKSLTITRLSAHV